jgi:predicted nucleic acid-binding protein
VKLFFDTTVLVASVVRQHPHHERAIPVIERALAKGAEGCVAAHGLAEMYAVLTTLPVQPRVSPDVAHRLVSDNVIAHFTVVALTGREYASLVSSFAERGVRGGATYDAIHLACARKANADRIYTFNVSDFRRLATDPDLEARISAP